MQTPIIRLTDVNMSCEERRVLRDVNLTINQGDFMAITGPNGGGKTTLLRIILKLIRPTSGQVEYLDEGRPTKRLSIGYLPQKNMIDSHFPITVADLVRSGLLADKSLDRGSERVEEMLRRMWLTDLAQQPIGRLSGGQLQRALLGRCLVANPRVLVLDEPLSYLDKRFEHHLYDILRQESQRREELGSKPTILLVSHEMSEIAGMANRHIIVDQTIHPCHSASHMVHYDCVDLNECHCPDCCPPPSAEELREER